MNTKFFYTITTWIQHILKIDATDTEVSAIKEKTFDKINKTTDILKEASHLQTKVIHKTATYYIGKAMGIPL